MRSSLPTRRLLGLALPAALVCAAALILSAGPTDAKKAQGPRASFVKGQVEVGGSQEGPFERLKRGRMVPPGHFVRTGEGARAELKFPDGSVVRIGPSSLLHVQEVGFDGKSKEVRVETTLVGGKAWANVSKLVGGEARFRVKTQNAVAGVRGTVFRVNIEEDRATVVKVYNGAVAVSNSPFFTNRPDKSEDVSPIDKDRKEIPPPFQQVTQKEWEQIVQKMMEVRIGPDGTMSQAKPFTPEEDKLEDAEWVNWNLSCDQGKCEY